MNKDSPSLVVPYLFSALVHGLFFIWVVFNPSPKSELPFNRDQVMDVSMVTMKEASGPVSAGQPEAPKAQEAPEPPPPEPVEEEASEPPPEDAVSIAEPEPEVKEAVPIVPEKPKVKKSLKKKTFKPKPVEKIKKKENTPKPDPKTAALEKLQEQVRSDEASGRYSSSMSSTTTQGQGGTQAMGGGGSQRQTVLINDYRIQISRLVEKNWAFSKQLAGDSDNLMTALLFRIMPNGEIRDIIFTQRSGNQYLDDAAYKAVVKTNPAPPFPKDLQVEAAITMGLRFTPEGMR